MVRRCVFAISLVAAAIVSGCTPPPPYVTPKPFDAALWSTGDCDLRAQMVEDLLNLSYDEDGLIVEQQIPRQSQLFGSDVKGLKKLLGSPIREWFDIADFDAYVYNIGHKGRSPTIYVEYSLVLLVDKQTKKLSHVKVTR